MPFIKGQSGNPLVRARKPSVYTAYKDAYFSRKSTSNKLIMDNLYKAAEAGEAWAIKEWLRLYLPQATIQIDSTSWEISERRILVTNMINSMSDEEKQNFYDKMIGKEPIVDPVNLVESPVKYTQKDS